MRLCHLLLAPLGVAALVACSSPSTTSGQTSSGTGGVVSSSGAGASGNGGSGKGGSGGDPILNLDAGAGDAASTCDQLRIGIFGNPGSNTSSNFQQWLVSAGTSAERVQTTDAEPLTKAILESYDVVVLDWLTREYTSAEADTFAAWISAGGGAATMTGYNGQISSDWRANSLLAPLRVAYEGSLINGPATIFASHPITAGLTSVTFAGGYRVADLGGTGSQRTPIAFLPGDVNVGYAVEMGLGRAFVWGDEWIEFDSEWSTLPEIKQLWVQVFGWISPANTCELEPPS